jgi:hypothetical protein
LALRRFYIEDPDRPDLAEKRKKNLGLCLLLLLMAFTFGISILLIQVVTGFTCVDFTDECKRVLILFMKFFAFDFPCRTPLQLNLHVQIHWWNSLLVELHCC